MKCVRRVIASLTIASLAWGTVTILLLLAFGEGLKRQMMSNDQAMGNNLAIMWPGETSKPYKGLPEGRPVRPKMEDIDYARERLPELDAIWGEYTSWRTALTYGRKTVNGRVIGTRWEYGDARKHVPKARGRFINPSDEEEKRRVETLRIPIQDNGSSSLVNIIAEPVGDSGDLTAIVVLFQEAGAVPQTAGLEIGGKSDEHVERPVAVHIGERDCRTALPRRVEPEVAPFRETRLAVVDEDGVRSACGEQDEIQIAVAVDVCQCGSRREPITGTHPRVLGDVVELPAAAIPIQRAAPFGFREEDVHETVTVDIT